MGHIKRWITCVSIDNIDEYAYCGTRSGDVLEVSITKGIYSRSGPIDKKFRGCVNQVISKFKHLYVGTSEGTFAKIDKKTLNTNGEINVPHSSITGLAASNSKVYSYSDRSVIRSVSDQSSI